MKYDVTVRLRNEATKFHDEIVTVEAATGDAAAALARTRFLDRYRRVTVHGVWPSMPAKDVVEVESPKRRGRPPKVVN